MVENEQEEERSRLTCEALADVDAGQVIDHLVVLAWAESLDSESPLLALRYAGFLATTKFATKYRNP